MNEQTKKVKEILDSKYKIEGVNPEYHTQIAQQIVEALYPERTDMREAAARMWHKHWVEQHGEMVENYDSLSREGRLFYEKKVVQILALRPEMKVLSDEIDIPDCVFMSKEAKSVGFTKRSFLEAGWRKVISRATVEGK